jgi:hypothetical protein
VQLCTHRESISAGVLSARGWSQLVNKRKLEVFKKLRGHPAATDDRATTPGPLGPHPPTHTTCTMRCWSRRVHDGRVWGVGTSRKWLC